MAWLVPHLSHDDGEEADLAFYYTDDTGYLAEVTRSFIGYFAFEQGPTNCPEVWPALRWHFEAIQPLWLRYNLDIARNTLLFETQASDGRVGKIFVEPHLIEALGLSEEKVRFQGCRVARYDDHLHFQLNG